jgi:hypothetical protein
MQELSPATFALLVAEDFGRAHARAVTEEMKRELAVRIETALRAAIRHERTACVELCARRYELWASYEDRSGIPPELRVEARARANEAAHLADALQVSRD